MIRIFPILGDVLPQEITNNPERLYMRQCNAICQVNIINYSSLCRLIHVVVKNFISILVTDYIQKRRGQALLFSFEYNLLPTLISWIGQKCTLPAD